MRANPSPLPVELRRPLALSVPRRRAFTLIELLTVIAIIGILAAILIPVIGRARESAKGARCISNLRQVGVALHAYADENRGFLPPVAFTGISPYYNRDPRHIQHSLHPYLSLRRAANWGTSMDQSIYSAVFDCPSYKGAQDGKKYQIQSSVRLADGSTPPTWGAISNNSPFPVTVQPQRLSHMPSDAWAIRDQDEVVNGVAITAHPNARNALHFGGHVTKQPVNP